MDRLGYSVKELAAAGGPKKTTIFRLIKEGRLKTVKVGRRTIITAASAHQLFTAEAA